MSESLLGDALEAEAAGDYNAAVVYHALIGFQGLFTACFDSLSAPEALTHFLRALSFDVQAGNYRRARATVEFVEPYFETITTDAESACLRGLGHEWLGDLYLFLGDSESQARYQTAKEHFEVNEFESWQYWGAAPAYDNAYAAMDSFLEAEGIVYTNESLDFVTRLDSKLTLATKLLNTE